MEKNKQITDRVLIITGSARGVIDEIRQAKALLGAYDLMAIGLDAVDKYTEPIKYVATFHPAEIPAIRERRAGIGNTDYAVISHHNNPGVDICIVDWWQPSGSSSLLGVQAAMRIGYPKIIVCGCPLTGKNIDGGDYENFRAGWEKRLKTVAPYVRSMSGWTREKLGAPDEQWMKEEYNAS